MLLQILNVFKHIAHVLKEIPTYGITISYDRFQLLKLLHTTDSQDVMTFI